MATDGPPASGSFSAAPPAASLVGEVLDGRYRILKLIGEGGMGEVYAAEHVHIEKKYAIKLLRSEIVSNPEAVTRFRQEARSSSSIGHRNIIAIEDFGQLNDGRIYMCMELLNGAPLNDMIKQPMAVDRLLNILIQTGHGLGAAHAKGIVHRDMKPENIFVTIGPSGEDIPKLLDFGIAKVAGNDGQNHLTRTGTIFGTPFYMAPEQALGNPVDARTDIYAVGVIMYEVFAGSLPFQGESFMGILTQHITTEPEPVAQRAAKAGRVLAPGLADIITRCMQKTPAQRFSSMEEVVNQLIPIYRGLAGPGMSTYMEAFSGGGGGASHQSQPAMTPPHITAGQSTPMGAMGPGAPMGGAPLTGALNVGASPSGPVAVPGTAAGSSGLFNPAASVVDVPKKSKAGLFIALFAVLAVGGGVTAFALMNKGDSKSGTGSSGSAGSGGSVVAGTDPGSGSAHGTPSNGSATALPPTPGSGSAVAGNNPVAIDAGAATVTPPNPPTPVDAAVASITPTPIDAAETHVVVHAPADAAQVVHVTPPDAAVVAVATAGKEPVMINVRGVSAFEIWENGAKLTDGPDDVEIGPNETRTLVLKAHGFRDKQVTIDNSKHKEVFSLERIPGVTPPHPPKAECTDTQADMKNKACRKQFCAKHGNERLWERRCDVDDD